MKELNRRDFLLRVTAVGALTTGTGTLLAACGGGDAPPPPPSAAAPATAECTDLSGMTEQEKMMRTQLKYVDVTADPAKDCLNCALYVPAAEGASCGGCNLIKGPIAPKGFCISWAPKAT